MKKILFLFIVLFVSCVLIPVQVKAETLSLTSYYPSPFGVYSTLRLVPTANGPSPCEAGTLYVSSTDGRLYICNGADLYEEAGVWTQVEDDVYLKDFANPNVHVGIRTDVPDSGYAMDVVGLVRSHDIRSVNSSNALQSLYMGFSDGTGQAFVNAYDSGTSSGKTLRLNENGGTVGLGTGTVDTAYQLDVLGSARTQNLELYEAGTENRRLSVGFDTAIGAGFIAPYNYSASSWEDLIINSGGGTVAIGTNTPDSNYSLHVDGNVLTQTFGASTATDPERMVEIGYNSGSDYGWIQSFDHSLDTNMRLAIYPNAAAGGNLNVTVGTATASTYMLDVAGKGRYTGNLDVTNNGDVNVTSGDVWADAFFYNSDERLKENIKPAPGLESVLQLQGISFNWKSDGTADIGLSAQNVEKVLPELVVTNPGTHKKSVKYGNIIAPLIEAIKEQQEQIDALKEEIKNLRDQIDGQL